MLEIKIETRVVQLQAPDLRCTCKEECQQHPGDNCLDAATVLMDLGRGVILSMCVECAKHASRLVLEKLLTW